MRKLLMAAALVAAACSGSAAEPDGGAGDAAVVRILLSGDVSLGRGVARVAAAAPDSVFADLRRVVRSADLAMANLESPLTSRPHVVDNPNDLRADPGSGRLLAAAGFDLLGVANNHAGDAGPETVNDTVGALDAAGLLAVGGGAGGAEARRPVVLDLGGVSVGVLAFDATGHGPPAAAGIPGVAVWDAGAQAAIAALRASVDVLIVGVHGGAEYLLHPDDTMDRIAADLAAWNVDVVWGHGAHVVQPIAATDPDGDGRFTMVATSLGNLLFDQDLPGTNEGAILEVLAGPGGVVAARVGETAIAAGRVSFERWRLPHGDAALVDGEWWELTDPLVLGDSEGAPIDLGAFTQGDVVAAGRGDVDGDGEDEVVVSFRRPFRPAALHDLFPEVRWRDDAGRSAHIGVFATADLSPEWVASAMVRPVSMVAVCDGAIAVGYSTLDDDSVVASGGWVWSGFGWDEGPDLDGPATVGCRDVDGNGLDEPVVSRATGGADGL